MPSPNRGTEDSKIAYTRWEPQEAMVEDPDPDPNLRLNQDSNDVEGVKNNNNNQFHHFEVEGSSSAPSFSVIQRRSQKYSSRSNTLRYECAVKSLGILIIIGISWIVGFMTRWGVHHYYIDSIGHCVTPVAYHYDPETARLILEEFNSDSVKSFLEDYTSYSSHQIGSQESHLFAQNISDLWRDFGIPKVEISQVKNKIPQPDVKMPSKITILDPADGKAVFDLDIPHEKDLVSFTPPGTAAGQLVYGHFGRFEDLTTLQRLHGLEFNNSVVMIKVNNHYHTGSMVRNAQMLGARAVILFPDPFPYILSKDHEQIGKLPSNITLNTDVKFVPGDPNSPYLEGESTMPRIPVVGISYDEAKDILLKYTNAYQVSHKFWYGMPLNTTAKLNFTAQVEVYRDEKSVTLNNVIGTIPGRYEPTRYVIIASHHDSWHKGAARPGIGHAVLMELVRTLGYEARHNWKPGRSIIFASWDGEEFGQLGSTAWLYSHAKELRSRAIVYIDLDNLLQGNDKIHIASSPLLKQVIMEAASSIECPENSEPKMEKSQEDKLNNSRCTLYDTLFSSATTSSDHNNSSTGCISVDGSPFQSILGISSLEVAMKNDYQGDAYPFTKTHFDTQHHVEKFLDLSQATAIGKFMILLTLKLVMSPKLPLSAPDYGKEIEAGIQGFMSRYADNMDTNGIPVNDILLASTKFTKIAKNFNNSFDVTVPALELLSYHEYNDQLLELERSFLLPPSTSGSKPFYLKPSNADVSTSTYLHVIYGPSPLDANKIDFLPRLRAALDIAKATEYEEDWSVVKRETFFVIDALESAACVLENHLIH